MKSASRIFLLLLLTPALLGNPPVQTAAQRALSRLPRLTLWAWEMPEHLEFIDPRQVAVAYLDQTVFVGRRVVAQPRLQPMQVAAGTQVMAVVRIEMSGDAPATSNSEVAVVAALLRSARRPGVSALQVDFDALQSQREFYGHVLHRLRHEMPPNMPLSVTALASWCAYDRWLTGLPVDEAVPMLFRMGKEQSLFRSSDHGPQVREPLCSASAGVSTDEPWPEAPEDKRIYVFHPRPWTPKSVAHVLEHLPQ